MVNNVNQGLVVIQAIVNLLPLLLFVVPLLALVMFLRAALAPLPLVQLIKYTYFITLNHSFF